MVEKWLNSNFFTHFLSSFNHFFCLCATALLFLPRLKPARTLTIRAKKRNLMKYTCIISPGGLNNIRCNITLFLGRRRKTSVHRLNTYCRLSWDVPQFVRFLLSIQPLSSHSDGRSSISEYSWASPKSAWSFLREFIKTQWTLTILLSPLPTASPSLWWGEGELYLDQVKSRKITKRKDSAVNLWCYCSNILSIVFLLLSDSFFLTHSFACGLFWS